MQVDDLHRFTFLLTFFLINPVNIFPDRRECSIRSNKSVKLCIREKLLRLQFHANPENTRRDIV